MPVPKPIMPKEHGLWAWVFLPFCVGAATAGGWGNLASVIPAVFFGFLVLTPARMIYKSSKKDVVQNRAARFWCVAYGIPAALGAGVSVWMDARLAVIFVIYALGFYLGVRASHSGYHRSMLFEYGGIAFLSMGAFFGAFAAAGVSGFYHMAVWAFVLIFILDRSSQTRQLIRARTYFEDTVKYREDIRLIMRINLFIALLAIWAISAALDFFMLNRILLLAYVPGIFLTVYFYVSPPRSLRVLGYSELALVFIFGILFTVIFNGFKL